MAGKLAHSYGVHDLGAYSLSSGGHVSECSGFVQAVQGYLLGSLVDGGVDRVPLGTEVDDGGVVAQVSFPDRTAALGPCQLELFRPRSPARVGFTFGRLLRLLAQLGRDPGC